MRKKSRISRNATKARSEMSSVPSRVKRGVKSLATKKSVSKTVARRSAQKRRAGTRRATARQTATRGVGTMTKKNKRKSSIRMRVSDDMEENMRMDTSPFESMRDSEQERRTKFIVDQESNIIETTTIVDAPRDSVYQAYTDPAVIPEWWGPRGYATEVVELDVRPGGRWQFVNIEPNGNRHVFFGTFREIVPGKRIEWTFNYEPMQGHESVDVVTFEDIGDKTRITTRTTFLSVEDRDGMLSSGMEKGFMESMERLSEHLTGEA
jgi:uncharacterized protein YndB with AHSA1/START domain